MNYLIDTNVILDVLLKRNPFYYNSAEILNLSAQDNIHDYKKSKIKIWTPEELLMQHSS